MCHLGVRFIWLQVRELAYLPLAEDIPIAFNSCRKVRGLRRVVAPFTLSG